MVPDDTLTIRERAIAAWPTAWHGQNLRDILTTLGYDVDKPWRDLPKKDRNWILFTEEQPTVPVYAGYDAKEVRRALKRKEEPSYQGTFTGARRYVLQTFANTHSAMMKKRVAQYHARHRMSAMPRQAAEARGAVGQVRRHGYRRHRSAPVETAGGTDAALLQKGSTGSGREAHPEKAIVVQRIAQDLVGTAWCAARSGPRLSHARTQHADFVARANCSACGWRRRSAPISSAWSMCSTSRRPGCTRRTPRRCCARSTG